MCLYERELQSFRQSDRRQNHSFAFINMKQRTSRYLLEKDRVVAFEPEISQNWSWFFTSRACLACLHPSPLSPRALFLFLSRLLSTRKPFSSCSFGEPYIEPEVFHRLFPADNNFKKGGWLGEGRILEVSSRRRRIIVAWRVLLFIVAPRINLPFFQTPCSNASAIRRFANKYINPSTCSLNCRLVRKKREKLRIRSCDIKYDLW